MHPLLACVYTMYVFFMSGYDNSGMTVRLSLRKSKVLWHFSDHSDLPYFLVNAMIDFAISEKFGIKHQYPCEKSSRTS